MDGRAVGGQPVGEECSGLWGASSGAKTAMTARPTTTSSEISATGSWRRLARARRVRCGSVTAVGSARPSSPASTAPSAAVRAGSGRCWFSGAVMAFTSVADGGLFAGWPDASGATWQAASWPPVLSRSSGRTLRQMSMAAGHRGWNGQPGGGLAGSGGSPVTLAGAGAAPAEGHVGHRGDQGLGVGVLRPR